MFTKYESELNYAATNCKTNYCFDFLSLLGPACHEKPCILGIDEAGRGPVLGPMIYASAVALASKSDDLKALGLADSKVLTEVQREALLESMLDRTEWVAGSVHVLSPVHISENMLDRCKTSLNKISHDSAIGLIQNALDKGINVTEVYVDTVGKADIYQAKLQALFPQVKVVVESKADDTYPIVSGASIFAKVTRDRLLKLWPVEERGPVAEDTPLGSGYPGDPLTKQYLGKCLNPIFGFPSIVRASWSTADNLLAKFGANVAWEDDDNAEKAAEAKRLARKRELAKGSSKLSAFFTPESSAAKKAATRQPFFSQCSMVHVDKLT